jgi:hypothetical protein
MRQKSDDEIMVLFLVNAHQADIRAPVSLQPCAERKVIGYPLCLRQDRSWARQSLSNTEQQDHGGITINPL